MRFACLSYLDFATWEGMSQPEQAALVKQCMAYDEELRRGGHILQLDELQSGNNTATVRLSGGQVSVTDGPFVETKEQLGGLLMLEARDLSHAVSLLSKHPGLRISTLEVHPVVEPAAAS